MRACLRDVHSPDADDLAAFSPPTATFSLLVQMLVGPSDGDGEESFDVLVCSPDWLRHQADPVIGRHLLIVSGFKWGRIRSFLDEQVAACEGADWLEVVNKVGRIGRWEFEDYRP
jgi:Immunity protein 8